MIEAGDDTAFLNEGSSICLNLSSNDLNDSIFEIARESGQINLHTFKSLKKRPSPAKKAQPRRKRSSKCSGIYQRKCYSCCMEREEIPVSYPLQRKNPAAPIEGKYRHYCLLKAVNNLIGRKVVTAENVMEARAFLGNKACKAGSFSIEEMIQALLKGPYELQRRKQWNQLTLESQNKGLFIVLAIVGPQRQVHAFGFDANLHHYTDQSKKGFILPENVRSELQIRNITKIFEVQSYDIESNCIIRNAVET